jgi:hypothetical protein
MQIAHKSSRVLDGSLADLERSHKLCVRIHRHEYPLISDFTLAISHVPLFLLNVGPDFIALKIAAAEVSEFRIEQPLTTRPKHFQQPQDGVAVEPRESFGAADRAAFGKALNRPCRSFLARSHGSEGRLRLGLAESSFAGIAAPALDSTLAVGSKPLAGFVLASEAGHGVSPLDFCAEKSHNEFGSGLWFTPRFGLAPQPVSAGSGALCVSYLGWWLDRDFHGVTGSECNLYADSHAGFILPESPVPAGLSHLVPKSLAIKGFVPSGQLMLTEFMAGRPGVCCAPADPLAKSHTPVSPAVLFDFSSFYQSLENRMNGRQEIFLIRKSQSLNSVSDIGGVHRLRSAQNSCFASICDTAYQRGGGIRTFVQVGQFGKRGDHSFLFCDPYLKGVHFNEHLLQ